MTQRSRFNKSRAARQPACPLLRSHCRARRSAPPARRGRWAPTPPRRCAMRASTSRRSRRCCATAWPPKRRILALVARFRPHLPSAALETERTFGIFLRMASAPSTTQTYDLAGVTPARRLTDDQQLLSTAVADFCIGRASTHEQRAGLSKNGTTHHNAEISHELGELGYLGASLPESAGGMGGGTTEMCIVLEETTYGRLPLAGFSVAMIVAGAYERFGSTEQQEDVLSSIAAGDVHAIAMSEPGSGSDVASMRTKAIVEGNEIVLNGHKTWITCAMHSRDI